MRQGVNVQSIGHCVQRIGHCVQRIGHCMQRIGCCNRPRPPRGSKWGWPEHGCPVAALFVPSRVSLSTQDPGSLTIPLPPTSVAASPWSYLGRWGVEELGPGREGWGGLAKRAQEACPSQTALARPAPPPPPCPSPLGRPLWNQHCSCATRNGHPPPPPPPILGEGCASLLIKGEFPLWMSDKRQPRAVPLLNPKESSLSLSGVEQRATLRLLPLSHPGEDKTSPHDPSQRTEPGQTGAWSHPRHKIWAGRIHQCLTMDKGCPLCLPRAVPATPPDQKRACPQRKDFVPLVACHLPGFRMCHPPLSPLESITWPRLPLRQPRPFGK